MKHVIMLVPIYSHIVMRQKIVCRIVVYSYHETLSIVSRNSGASFMDKRWPYHPLITIRGSNKINHSWKDGLVRRRQAMALTMNHATVSCH